MRILLLEDDHQHASYIDLTLQREFPGLEIDQLETEKEFRDQLVEIVKSGYEVLIMDVMVPWTRLSRELVPPPPDVKEGGFFRAGVRCYDLLRNSSEELAKRVLFYTILDQEGLGLPEGTQIYSKN